MSYGPTPDLLIWDIAGYTAGGRQYKACSTSRRRLRRSLACASSHMRGTVGASFLCPMPGVQVWYPKEGLGSIYRVFFCLSVLMITKCQTLKKFWHFFYGIYYAIWHLVIFKGRPVKKTTLYACIRGVYYSQNWVFYKSLFGGIEFFINNNVQFFIKSRRFFIKIQTIFACMKYIDLSPIS